MVSVDQSAKFFSLFSEKALLIESAVDSRNVDECRNLIQEIQGLVSVNAPSLPAWDLQNYRERIDAYKKSLDNIKAPKKKFGFSKATKEAHEVNVKLSTIKSASGDEQTNVENIIPERTKAAFYLEKQTGQELNLEDVHGEVELRNLSQCKIRIRGTPATLYVSELLDCEVICDPVASSVLIVGFENSSLQVACQQLRIHKAINSTFRLHITSRSIIEDCRDIAFGALPENYPASEDSWLKSGLGRAKNNFQLVDDFNWLNVQEPSPNWKLLDE